MADLDGDLTFEDIECLFYHSYVNGCKAAEGFTVKYGRDDMETLLDDLYMDFIQVMPKFFATKKK
ncbi:hypothetical protein [Nafulsella turpanensis]|uniref:hypothetical protein n=1 Tax=Nafulsella turpanensis TaxID=1265690 RepID=UPI000345FEDF|nr:hypothetical protein [Nafulsella turpanensis]